MRSGVEHIFRGELFGEVDLERMSAKVKHQPFVNVVQGLFYFSRAYNEQNVDVSIELFKRAIACYELCLQSDPTNALSLINCAESYHKMATFQQSCGKNMSTVVLDSANDYAQAADVYYLRALQVNQYSEEYHYLYARFLERCSKWTQAEKYHLLGLEINPLSVGNLVGYSQMLRQRGELAWANRFENRMEEVHRISKQQTVIHPSTTKKAPNMRKSSTGIF